MSSHQIPIQPSAPLSASYTILITLPLYYAMALVPHFYSLYLISSARKNIANENKPITTTSSTPLSSSSSSHNNDDDDDDSNSNTNTLLKPTYHASNPRSITQISNLKTSMPPQLFARYERSRAAHTNTTEGFSVAAASVLVAAFHPTVSQSLCFSTVPTVDLLCWLGLIFRAVYLVVYVFVLDGERGLGRRGQRWSRLRTGFWSASMICYFIVIGKAAFASTAVAAVVGGGR